MIMVGLRGNGVLSDLEKGLNVAYQDVLNEFDLNLGVNDLVVTKSNLVVT
jgi:hypothetical protein